MESHLTYLLDLRLRVRGNAAATALVDRCLALHARAQGADLPTACELDRELDQIRDELAVRFGAPRAAVLQ